VPLIDESKRGRAASFSNVAGDYDRARPSYPIEAVAWMIGPRRVDVLDLGAGTGKLTALLLASGHRVVAVEPLDELRRKLIDALPQARALPGRAEDIPLPEASVDAVAVGQAFHWFETGPALGEIARVLRPGGILGLIWNFRDDSQPWMRELSAIAGRDGLREGWTREFAARPTVTSIERRDFRLGHRVDRETLLALVRSWSDVASLDATPRGRLLADIEDLWGHHPQLRGNTEATLTYRTETYRVRVS
jgi:SAM-dependent methyltransferase